MIDGPSDTRRSDDGRAPAVHDGTHLGGLPGGNGWQYRAEVS